MSEMRFGFIKAASVAVALLAASVANAVTVDFTTLSNDSVLSKTFTVGGVTTTATARDFVGTPSEVAGNVALRSSPSFVRGLGVLGTTDANNGAITSGQQLDFTLQPGATVTGISLSKNGTSNSLFSLFVDGLEVFANLVSAPNNSSSPGDTFFDLSSLGITGSVFSVRGGSSGGVFVNSIDISPAPVPLPATAPILVGGLAAGGMMLRRRRKLN